MSILSNIHTYGLGRKVGTLLAASMLSMGLLCAPAFAYVVPDTPDDVVVEVNPSGGESVIQAVDVTIAGQHLVREYNGQEQTALAYDIVSISDPNFPASNIRFVGNTQAAATNAGTGCFMGLTAGDFEASGDRVVNFTVEDGSLTIVPKPLQVITDSAKAKFTGDPLTAGGRVEGLVNGETVSFKVTGKQTDVGESQNGFELRFDGTAKETNYTLATPQLGTLKVTEGNDPKIPKKKPTPAAGQTNNGANAGTGNAGTGNGTGNGNGNVATTPAANDGAAAPAAGDTANDGSDESAATDEPKTDEQPTEVIEDDANPLAGPGALAPGSEPAVTASDSRQAGIPIIPIIVVIVTALAGFMFFWFRRKRSKDEESSS